MKSIRIWMTLLVLGALAAGGAYTLAQSLSGEAEVRINARRLDDGRTEFALQQRTDGEWGERALPDIRYFPANPGHNRWLHSSPLTIEAAQTAPDDGGASAEALAAAEAKATAAQDALAEAEARLAKLEAPIYREEGTRRYDDGRITAKVERLDFSSPEVYTLHSRLHVQQDGQIELGNTPLVLEIGCFGSYAGVEVLNIAVPPMVTDYEWGVWEEHEISYRFTPAPEHGPGMGKSTLTTVSYTFDRRRGLYSLSFHPNSYWYTSLRQAESVDFLIEGDAEESVSATFSMGGVWDTPITPNLDRCGTYYFD